MTVFVALEDASSATTGWLVAAEPLPDSQALGLGILRHHLALGALLTAAAALGIAIVCQRLVVRPVRWLVDAADGMAQGDQWEPIRPESRRRDEIGVLGDHLADLSSRLSSAVRSARHGSAHLVALRVRREMEEPLHRLTVSLATLEAVGADDPELKRELQVMGAELYALREVSIRLAEVRPEPESDCEQRSEVRQERG